MWICVCTEHGKFYGVSGLNTYNNARTPSRRFPLADNFITRARVCVFRWKCMYANNKDSLAALKFFSRSSRHACLCVWISRSVFLYTEISLSAVNPAVVSVARTRKTRFSIAPRDVRKLVRARSPAIGIHKTNVHAILIKGDEKKHRLEAMNLIFTMR